MRLALLFIFGVACSDYQINQEPDVPPVDEVDSDPVVHDSDPVVHDSDPVVHDSEPVVHDSEPVVHDSDPLPPDAATEPIYLNNCCGLYSFDPDTLTARFLGEFRNGGEWITEMTDIAIDLDGHMYGTDYNALWRIDSLTAELTWIGYHAASSSLNALTFVSDGRLIAAAGGTVFEMSVTTAQMIEIATGSYYSSGDIVGLPDGLLYWSVYGGDGIVVVDPDSGDMSYLGSMGYSQVFGMGYANGDLWGFTSNGDALQIDIASGNTAAAHDVNGTWWGATTNPVLWD